MEYAMQVIDNPPDKWIRCLREGNKVWLCKEQKEAIIASPFIPPEHCGGGIAGRIFISKNGRIENWFIRDDGNGLNKEPLIRPIEGHLPDAPVLMTSEEARILREEITIIKTQIANIQKHINIIDFLY
jgi:hypothetical protein